MDYFDLYQSNIKKIKGNGAQFTGLCPFHEDTHHSFSGNFETGLWTCFAGCGAGNAYQFAKAIGIDPEPYKNGTYPLTKVTPNNVSNKSRNGHMQEIRASELSHTDRKKALSYHNHLLTNFDELTVNLPWEIVAIKKTFTGYDQETGRFTFLHTNIRGRAVNLKHHKGKNGEQPYSIPGHGQSRLYPMHLIKEYNADLPLILAEGCKDVITLLSHAFQAVTSTTGAASFPDLTPLKAFKQITVLYDQDPAGENGGKEVAKALKRQSPESKITVAVWGSGKPEGWDITDHFSQDLDKQDLLAEFDEILNSGKKQKINKPPKRGYSIMRAKSFEESNFKKPKPIVEEILSEKGYGTIAGSDGVGKSFLALQFALSCSLGVPFLDYVTRKAVKVLLIQFELENGELLSRYKTMKKWFMTHFDNPPGSLNNLYMMTLEADTLIFSNQWKRIEATLKEAETDFDILIVDNLYTSTDVDVSNPHQLSPLLGEITRIAKENNLAVMLVNHHTKKTAEVKRLDKDMIRGGKNFTDWLTNAIQVGESSLSQDLRVFKITKQRSGKGYTQGIPQALRFDSDNLVFHRIGTIEREELHFIDPKTKPEFESIRRVEPYADKAMIFTASQYEAVVEEMKYSRKTAFNWLVRLEKWKVIQKEGHGSYKILKSELDKYGE